MGKLNKAISLFVSAAMVCSSIIPTAAAGQKQIVVGHETAIPTDDIKINIDSTSEHILFASEAEENKMANSRVDINEDPAKFFLNIADTTQMTLEQIIEQAKGNGGNASLDIKVVWDDLKQYLEEYNQELLDQVNRKREENKNKNTEQQKEQAEKIYEATKRGSEFIDKMLQYNNMDEFFEAIRKGDFDAYRSEIESLIIALFSGNREAIEKVFGKEFTDTLYGDRTAALEDAMNSTGTGDSTEQTNPYNGMINFVNEAVGYGIDTSPFMEPLSEDEYKNDEMVLISYDSGLASNSNSIGYKCAECGNYYSFGLVCSCGKILNGNNLSHAKNFGTISFTGEDGKVYDMTLTKMNRVSDLGTAYNPKLDRVDTSHTSVESTTDTTVSVVSSANLTTTELSRMGYSITTTVNPDDELTGKSSVIGNIVCNKCGKKPTVKNFGEWVVNTETTGASDFINDTEYSSATETLEEQKTVIEILGWQKEIRAYDNLINKETDENVIKQYEKKKEELTKKIEQAQKESNYTMQTPAEKIENSIKSDLQKIADDINNDKVDVNTINSIKKAFFTSIGKDIIEKYNWAEEERFYYIKAYENLEKTTNSINNPIIQEEIKKIDDDTSLSEAEKIKKKLEFANMTQEEETKIIESILNPVYTDENGLVRSHLSQEQIDAYMEAYESYIGKIKEDKKNNKELTVEKLGEYKASSVIKNISKSIYEGVFNILKNAGAALDEFNNNTNPFAKKVFYCPDCYKNADPDEKFALENDSSKNNFEQLIIPSRLRNNQLEDLTNSGKTDEQVQDAINEMIRMLQEYYDSIKDGKENTKLKEAMGTEQYLSLVNNMLVFNQEMADRAAAEAEQKRDDQYNENQEKVESFKKNDMQAVFDAANAGTKEAYENLNISQKVLYEGFKEQFGFTNWQDPEDVIISPDQQAAMDVIKNMINEGVFNGSNQEVLKNMAEYISSHTSISDNDYAIVTLDISNITASVKSNPATIVDDGVASVKNENADTVFILNPWSLSSGIDWTWTPTALGQFLMKRSVTVYDTTENIITYHLNLSAYLKGYEDLGISKGLLSNKEVEYKKYDYSGENSSNVRNVDLDDIIYTVVQGDMTNYNSGKDATERVE